MRLISFEIPNWRGKAFPKPYPIGFGPVDHFFRHAQLDMLYKMEKTLTRTYSFEVLFKVRGAFDHFANLPTLAEPR